MCWEQVPYRRALSEETWCDQRLLRDEAWRALEICDTRKRAATRAAKGALPQGQLKTSCREGRTGNGSAILDRVTSNLLGSST